MPTTGTGLQLDLLRERAIGRLQHVLPQQKRTAAHLLPKDVQVMQKSANLVQHLASYKAAVEAALPPPFPAARLSQPRHQAP